MDPFIPFAVAAMVLGALALRSIKSFDELVEVVWEHHHDLWVAQGRPIGTFWRPEDPEVKLISSLNARRRLRSGLMLRTPDWIPEDSPAHLKIATYRITTTIGWGGMALLGVVVGLWGALGG